MGFTPKDVVQLFFNQGLILGLIGGMIGLIFGVIICHLMAQIEVVPGRMSGPGNKMIISFSYIIYLKAFGIAMLSSVFSSIIPAREAGKLEPMEIIRSGGQ
jgi:lipoprotein-releasing system permease protein